MPRVGLSSLGINSIQNVRDRSNMELHGWQQCQRKPLQCAGTLTLLPPSWDTISSIYSQVLKLVSRFPYNKRVVVYFAYKGITVKLDLGDARAAGVVCILGLGVGLGALFIYRLYRQYIQPFLDRQCADPEKLASDDSCHLSDSSDSGVDGAMGNNSSGSTPAVFYSPQYGVALGKKGPSSKEQEQTVADNVRFRRMGTRWKPACKGSADRDSRSSRSSHLNPSVCDPSIRDSFYSTAESGFETLPECNEEEEEESQEERSPSLKENFSVSSLKERSDRYFASVSGIQPDLSPSDNKTAADVPNSNQEEFSCNPSVPVVRTEPASSSSEKSSPLHKGSRIPETHLLSAKKCSNFSHSEDYEDDPSLDASESIRSFNSSGEEWSWEEEEKSLSPFPATHTAMTDSQFRQSLMQRIREWSTFAEEYGKSRSPTPDCASQTQLRHMRRSLSLDHHLGEPVSVAEVDISSSEPISGEDCTIKNLENLETEFHDIQDEFESITSKLHELIERGANGKPQQQSPAKSSASHLPRHLNLPLHRHTRPRSHNTSPHHRPRTKWERMPSLARSDSSRSSRASSVEFSWDCGEVIGDALGSAEGLLTPELSQKAPELNGDGKSLLMKQDAAADKDDQWESNPSGVTSIGESVSIKSYADSEWKGTTSKAKTIKQGYYAIPELFHCQHLRRVRGDNYCALRSTLFQVLVDGHRVTERWPGLISIVDRLHELNANKSSGLQFWNFAGRLTLRKEEEKFSRIVHCVLSLYAVIEEMSILPTKEERLARTLSLLNGPEHFDIELMEGLKLMMLFRTNDLQRDMSQGVDVPTFAWLMFARDTSSDVVSFVQNHLNCVGDSAGIDQVEMCLLGHCLGVKLQVARLDHHGQEDFTSTFPDEVPEEWPSVYLIAEDDRHYNVPVE